MFCSQCGQSNAISARFCSGCGTELLEPQHAAPVKDVAMTPLSNSEEYYKAILGPKNQDYYLRRFSRFDGDGKTGPSWHWPAFFVTFYWLLYRKMWLSALIYFLLPYLLMVPLGIAAAFADKSADTVTGFGYLVYLVAVFLLPPIYANAHYYNHCKKKISEARASSQDLQRQLGELSGRGGTSNVALIVILVFGVITMVGILAAIALPAYQDYTTRAHLAEAATIGRSAAESVATYYYQHQQPPSTLEEAGFSAPLPSSVRAIGINSENGVVAITMSGGPIEGKVLLLVPSLDSNRQIIWKCMSQDIQDKYLPRHCRQQQ